MEAGDTKIRASDLNNQATSLSENVSELRVQINRYSDQAERDSDLITEVTLWNICKQLISVTIFTNLLNGEDTNLVNFVKFAHNIYLYHGKFISKFVRNQA